MVHDPVCNMSLDPATALKSEYNGMQVYFCSGKCQRRFLENPSAYEPLGERPDAEPTVHSGVKSHEVSPLPMNAATLGIAVAAAMLASAALLALYFGVLTVVSNWDFAREQFAEYGLFIIALSIGFGLQVGLFAYLRLAARAAASGKVLAASGTTSGAAMLSCCTHYLVNLVPALGATGLMTLVSEYQVQLLWVGVASNVVGIAFMLRRVVAFAQGV